MERPAMRVTGPVLDAPDVGALTRFYGRLLGWEREEVEGPRLGPPLGGGWPRVRAARPGRTVAMRLGETAWTKVMDEHADRWNVGDVSFKEVSAALADAAAMTVPEVEAHARRCCAQLRLHLKAWKLARQHRWPQALVTVNPDLFADF